MSKADRTKTFIIEKTAPVFNKKGFAGTSLSDLTDVTGLTKGALYGNFKNKDEIALAAFDFNVKMIREGFAPGNAQSAIDRLLYWPDFYKKRFKQMAAAGGCPILNTAVEADDNQPLLKKKVNAAISSWRSSIEETIMQGVATGEIKPDVHAATYATTFIALLEGGIMLSKVTGDLSYFNHALDRIEIMIRTELAK